MAITKIAPYSSNLFSAHADLKSMTTEISTLAGPLVRRLNQPDWKPLYDDACDVGFVIESVRTGRLTRWYLDEVKKDREGDITHWEFAPTTETLCLHPQLHGWVVTVFND